MFYTKRNLIFLGIDLQPINSFLTVRRIATTCRLLITTTGAVLNDTELSDPENFIYSVLYAKRLAIAISSLNEIVNDS